MESVDKMDSLADTVHGAVEIADSLQTANEQAKLVENFDNEINNNNEIATVDNILNQTDENFDIDFGKIGNFIVKCGINLILPFVNGMMMGFGEILAHEICFRHNWTFARVCYKSLIFHSDFNFQR